MENKITWWRHQMETFSALLAICAGYSPVIGEFPTQKPVTRSFDGFFDLRLNERWVNNRETSDLRPHRAHYDVTVIVDLNEFSQYFSHTVIAVMWAHWRVSEIMLNYFHAFMLNLSSFFLKTILSYWLLIKDLNLSIGPMRDVATR